MWVLGLVSYHVISNIAQDLLRPIALGEMLRPRHYLPARLAYRKINADTATGPRQFWHTRFQRRNALIDGDTLAHACRSEATQLLGSLAQPCNLAFLDLLRTFH